MRTSGIIHIRATALEPIHHGAGVSGNTSLMRMQAIVLPDGTPARVPFISGNSVKNRLRRAATRFALDALKVEDGTLTKREVNLLMSGGSLTSGGSTERLDTARRLEALFPALGMCGYSAGNSIRKSKLAVAHLHLVCAENRWRLPDDLYDAPHAALRAGQLRGEEFGTRHDTLGDPSVGRLLTADELESAQERKASGAKTEDDTQMIYDFQTLSPGSTFWGSVRFDALTELELAALASAFHYASVGERAQGSELVTTVGAKSAVGFGAISLQLHGEVRAAAAQYTPSSDLVGPANVAGASAYVDHLHTHRDEIIAAIREVAQ